MRADGIFIAVEVSDEAARDNALAVKLAEACPVDIFVADDSGVQLVQGNLDECVLCGLCLDAAAGMEPNPVQIIKLYDNEAALTRG